MTGLDLDRLENVGIGWITEAQFAALVALAREAERLREALAEIERYHETGQHTLQVVRGIARAALSPDADRGET